MTDVLVDAMYTKDNPTREIEIEDGGYGVKNS